MPSAPHPPTPTRPPRVPLLQALDIRGNESLATTFVEDAAAGLILRLQQLGADVGWLARNTALLAQMPALTVLYLEEYGASPDLWDALLGALAQSPPQLVELGVPEETPSLQAIVQARPVLRIVGKSDDGWLPWSELIMPAFEF